MARRKSTFWTSRNTAIAGLIFAIPFILIVIMLAANRSLVNQIDYNIGSILHNLRNAQRNEIAIGVTTIGDVWSQTAITFMTVTLLLTLKEFKAALWYGVTVLIGAAGINAYMKSVFGRIRPDYIEHLVHETTYAFPSGHAMGTTIVFGGIAFIIYRLYKRQRGFTTLAAIFCLSTAFLIGLSRVYLGVHYPTDVLGGFSLGAAWLFFSIAVYGLKATE